MNNNSENQKTEISKDGLHTSKAYILALLIIMWVGVVLCVFSWIKNFSVFGLFPSYYLGIGGGVIILISIALQIFSIKCPYCGAKKLGRAIGMKLKKTVECPDCHKTVDIR